MDIKQYIKTLRAKLSDPAKLQEELDQLDQVPPAPGRPDLQHDTMVAKGLCREADRYPLHNRYCNQYPFDKNLVR